MKLPDVNLFVYAYDASSARHAAARDWLEEVLSDSDTIGLTWAVLVSFIRLSTSSTLLAHPFDIDAAVGLVRAWLGQPCTTIIAPTERHLAVLQDLLVPLGSAGNLTSDAHLAALAIEHGATVYSCDNDFSRFSGVRWIDPLRA